MGTDPLHYVSVAGVTLDNVGRVLLIKRRDNGQWQAPGGVLELGETLEQGVVREVAEETGVSVEPTRLTGVYKNVHKNVVALVFRCEVVGGQALPTEESQDTRWIEVEEAMRLMEDVFSTRVADALIADGCVVRSHDGRRFV